MQSQPDFHGNFDRFFTRLNLDRRLEAQNEQLRLRASAGTGGIRRIKPRQDLEIVRSDYRMRDRQHIRVELEAPMVELSFCFRGERETVVSGRSIIARPGMCTLQFVGPSRTDFVYEPRQPTDALAIGMPVSAFEHFMDGVDNGKEREERFGRILGGQTFRAFHTPIDPAAGLILERLRVGIEAGTLRNLELESRTLELLALTLIPVLEDDRPAGSKLSRGDFDKVRQAREVILSDLQNPPGLLELSRKVGLNDYKLKIGFKELYGTTVFGCLRERRLEAAYRLLSERDCGVSEAAFAVGYCNPSYFAENFRRRYGVNPSALVRG